MVLIELSLLFRLLLASPFQCDDVCPSDWVSLTQIGDDYCDLECMIAPCNFDTFPGYLSDCQQDCEETGCNLQFLGNGECNSECSSNKCGFDYGDCGYCAFNCTQEMLENSVCDQVCDTYGCNYDNGYCETCAEGCYFKTMLDNAVCDQACNTYDCNYDNGYCNTCAEGCYTLTMLGNGVCDQECNVESCQYDNLTCGRCADNCTFAMLNNEQCELDCYTELCNYDNGNCGYCAFNCTQKMLENSVCDQACHTYECNYDNGYCEMCAKGCYTLTMLGNGVCDQECNVWSCQYDNLACGRCADNCTFAMMNNDQCEVDCDTRLCNYDYGNCGDCALNCTQEMRKNSVCDEECDTYGCNYDNGYCRTCAEGCYFKTMLDNAVCDEECDTYGCNYDNGYCKTCAEGCYTLTMLDNGVCDQECNVESCQYDNLTCGRCADNCTFAMMNNDQCEVGCCTELCNYDNGNCRNLFIGDCNLSWIGDGWCNEVCYTETTNWDDGDCDCDFGCTHDLQYNSKGYCAEDCYLNMLGNGVCDEMCRTRECNSDNGDCECSPGCDLKYAYCNVACLVPQCNYDSFTPGCYNEFMFHLTVIEQQINKNFTAQFQLDDCLASAPSCDLYLLYQGFEYTNCIPGCNTKECGYSFGYCDFDPTDSCHQSFGSGPDQCLVCGANYHNFYTTCVQQCPRGYLADPFGFGWVSLCIPAQDKSTDTSPGVIYVMANTNESYGGDGSFDKPYGNLVLGLVATMQKYSIIYLLGDVVACYNNTGLSMAEYFTISSIYHPLLNKTFAQLIIQSLTCDLTKHPACSNSTSQIDVSDAFFFDIAGNATFINVNFTTIHLFAHSSYRYCPYIANVDGTWVNDRGNEISGDELSASKLCEAFSDYSVFIVRNASSLTLQNVGVVNLTLQMLAFINIQGGAVVLENVIFKNVQPSLSYLPSAVILQSKTCSTSFCGSLVYRGGSITYLNNGFEYISNTILNPFLYARSLSSLEVSNVKFQYNMVVDAFTYLSLSSNALIYLQNFLKLSIQNCQFLDNFLTGGAIAIESSQAIPTYLDSNKQVYLFFSTHLLFKDLIFGNNFGELGIIQVAFSGDLLNVALINCTFYNNALTYQDLVAISYSGKLTTDAVSGSNVTVVDPSTNTKVVAWVPPRFLNITNVSFQNHSSFTDLISTSNCANVQILDLNCSINGDFNLEGRKSVISLFLSQPLIYATMIPDFGVYESCVSLVSFTQTENTVIENVLLTNNFCSYGGAGFSLSQCTGSNTITNYTSSWNQGSDIFNFGLALQCGDNVNIKLKNLTMRHNMNRAGSLLQFSTDNAVSLSDSLFTDNVGDVGVCVHLEGAASAIIHRVTFINNTDHLNVGGVVYYRLRSLGQSTLEVIDSQFTSNSANQGGCIYISAFELSTVSFLLLRVQFTSNSAQLEGSILYIEPLVMFATHSKLDTCTLHSNTSPNGALYLKHQLGTLTISNSIFSRNSGSIVSVICIESPATTVIQSTTFDANLGGPVVLKPNSRVPATLATADCTFTNNPNTAVTMEGGDWTDHSSMFNTAHTSQVILLLGAKANITSSIFDSNSGAFNGGVIYLGSSSFFDCMKCIFTNNSAISGGAIYSEQNSCVNISASRFQGNRAQYGSAITLSSSYYSVSSISTSTFTANVGSVNGLIYLLWAVLTLDGSYISENTGGGCPGVFLLLSTLSINNSTFQSQSGDVSPFLELLTSSSANITQSTFTNGFGQLTGGLYIIESSLTMSDSSFKTLSGYQSGAISAGSESFVGLIHITMNNVSTSSFGGLIYTSDSSLTIRDSQFMDYSIGGIYGNNMMKVEIVASTFTNGMGLIGAAVFCSQCTEVDISDSTFTLQNGTYGGAIGIVTSEGVQMSGQLNLINNTFANNSAYWGAGAYISNMNVFISSCTFYNNTASQLDSTQTFIDGQGGGILLYCTIISLCHFNVSFSNFTNNSAAFSGGAIAWNLVQPVVTNLTMLNNQASYASNIASFAFRVKVLSVSNQRRLLGTLTNITDIPPGQTAGISLVAALVDHYEQIITTDNSSAAELTPINLKQASVSGMSKVTALNGIFTFDNFMIYADPNSTTQIKLSSPSISNAVNANASITLNFNMRGCVQGESIAVKSCLLCNEGTYSFNPSKPCLTCPANAICLGNTTVLPDPGYWRSGIFTDIIMPCPYSGACLGGQPANQPINLTGACATGYTSNLCQSCTVGFSRSGNNKCGQCPEENTNIIRITFIAIAVVIIECILVWSTLRSVAKPAALHSIYFKIFANYFQLVWLVTEFKLHWPDQVLQLFNAQQQTGGVTEQVYSFDCFIGNNKSAADTFYDKIIFIAVLPFGLIAAAVIFWVGVAMWKHSGNILKRELAATIVILFFLIHPNLVKSLFSMFSCTEVNSGEFWLTTDMVIKCWDSTHLLHIFAVGIPAIVVWVFGVPLISLLVLIKYRRRQEELWLKMQFGFLLNGYKRRRFYWEFVILFRKILVICCSVFLTYSIPMQALTVQVVLMIALFLQYSIEPFGLKQLNSMELMAISVADITIYCGLYYLTDDLDNVTTWLFFIFIIVANVIFLVYWLSIVLHYAVTVLAPKVPCLGHILRPEIFLRDSYIDDFVDNYKKNPEKLKQFANYDLHQIHLKMLENNSDQSLRNIPYIRGKGEIRVRSRNETLVNEEIHLQLRDS